MTYQVKKRVPKFCDSDEVYEWKRFSTIEELEKIRFVKNSISNENFLKLSVTDSCLMVEMIDGTAWAIGWLDSKCDILPRWNVLR